MNRKSVLKNQSPTKNEKSIWETMSLINMCIISGGLISIGALIIYHSKQNQALQTQKRKGKS